MQQENFERGYEKYIESSVSPMIEFEYRSGRTPEEVRALEKYEESWKKLQHLYQLLFSEITRRSGIRGSYSPHLKIKLKVGKLPYRVIGYTKNKNGEFKPMLDITSAIMEPSSEVGKFYLTINEKMAYMSQEVCDGNLLHELDHIIRDYLGVPISEHGTELEVMKTLRNAGKNHLADYIEAYSQFA